MPLKSHLPKINTPESAGTKSSLRQLQMDAKQMFGEKECEVWMMMNPTTNSIARINERQPQLKGVRKREITNTWTHGAIGSAKEIEMRKQWQIDHHKPKDYLTTN